MEGPQSEEITTNFIPRDQKVVNITDLKIIKLNLFGDDRGFFVEKFKLSEFAAADCPGHGLT